LKKAGVKAWPKLFQNLRASRATELAAAYPEYMAAAWCGHSEKIAVEHYWQITEDDWQLAATRLTGEGVLNPVQKAGPKVPENTPETPNPLGPGDGHRGDKTPKNTGKTRFQPAFDRVNLAPPVGNEPAGPQRGVYAETTAFPRGRSQPGPKSGQVSPWLQALATLLDSCPEALQGLRDCICELVEQHGADTGVDSPERTPGAPKAPC
jgi:hypothetical protein